MELVRKPVPLAARILRRHRLSEGEQCRLLTYIVRAEHPDGTLLYNVMNKAIVLLNAEETALIDALPAPFSPKYEALAQNWFVVPEGNDDMALSDGLKDIARSMDSEEKPLTSYTIFTTTDCNARCYYCFEAGTRRYSMTEETAHDVAEYIRSHCGRNKVTLHWFGGEPLLNTRVIDIICEALHCTNIEYDSVMTTNGYCFEPKLIQKAKECWHLEKVQITLDGTEEEYNKRKRFVVPDNSPYTKVMGNIELLLNAGIAVHVRCNADKNNIDDIESLCKHLVERFDDYDNLHIRVTPIFEDYGYKPIHYDTEDRESLWKSIQALENFLKEKGVIPPKIVPNSIVTHQCMADNPSCITVLADGRLGRCEHYPDSEAFGSIYHSEIDDSKLKKWHEYDTLRADCGSCCRYPECMLLKPCSAIRHECTEYVKETMVKSLRRNLLYTYEIS